MPTWLIIAYGILWMVSIRPVAGHLAWKFGPEKHHYQTRPDEDDWFSGIFCALLLGATWPVVLAYLASTKFTPAVGAERRAIQKQKAEEREEQIANQQIEINRLEKRLLDEGIE